MKKMFAGATALLVVAMFAYKCDGARAADMPIKAPMKLQAVVPAPALTGFYVGAHAGAAGSTQQTMFVTTPGVAASAGLPGKIYPSGIPVGGVAGWGTALGSFYGAVEADIDANNDKTSGTCSWPVAGNVGVNTICGSKPGWISTQRVLFGLSVPTLTGAVNRAVPVTAPSLPIPISVPASLSAMPVMLLADVGIAEKAVNGYVSPTNVGKIVFPGGSQTQTEMGLLVGGVVKVPLASQWNGTFRYDHVIWNKAFTAAQSAGATAVFPSSATFKQQPEDRLLAGMEYGF